VRIALCLLLASATILGAQAPVDSRRELSNVAAFARLYGAVRYFYPSDAAAALDWDRFAVLGAGRVRSARDILALETTLNELFAPLGPGIELGARLSPAPLVGSVDASLVSWKYMGPGISGQSAPYSGVRSNRTSIPAPQPNAPPFVTILQSVPATDLRGKRIRLRARARVTALDRPGWAGLWLRVDRAPQVVGFFDNMRDRPIRQTEWREYVIEGPVDDDATAVFFGALASESIPAEFDAFELAVSDGDVWKPLTIRDPGFEAGSDPRTTGWGGNAATGTQLRVSEQSAPEGQRFVRLQATVATSAAGPVQPNVSAKVNTFLDIDLAQGLRARVRTALTDAEARVAASALSAAIPAIAPPGGRSDLDVRLADVVVAWNVLRHFYPYWDVAGVDWDARLVPQLEAAYRADGRDEHRRALLHLVEEARDGHGNVTDTTVRPNRGALPIALRLLEGRLVVSATSVPSDVPVGTVVVAIAGRNAMERLASEMGTVSGSIQWKRWRAAREIAACTPNTATPVSLDLPDGGKRNASLACETQAPVEGRPEKLAELAPGIRYVDLSRATTADLKPALASLASATGVVFDLRGYPTDIGAAVLPFLVAEAETGRWMHVAEITGPFGQIANWQSFGWNLVPAAPRIASRRVFLTDGRAISYAESVMGYVKARKLGTIVGGATAGANGNVVRGTVPGGFAFTFTGMRVTGHDGKAQQHLIGILPDIPLEPTVAGIRAGRDELLERAMTLIRDGK
jgi:hypothetical protein